MIKKSLFLLLLFFSVVLHAQEVDLAKLDQYFEKALTDWGTPGMSVAIVKDGQTVFSKGYGVMEAGEAARPDGNSLYAIASNSKAFTSYVIAQLVDEGQLNWDDKVQKFLPYFELYDPWVSAQVTVKDLLCHRVGLGTFSGDVMWYKSDLTSEEIIRRMKYLEPEFSFRDGFGYSNLMYITAGELIKKVTGKTWGQNVQERILDPLKMDRTVYSLPKLDVVGNYTTPHAFEDGKNVPIPYTDWEEVGALGGLISSVNDMAKWMAFMMSSENKAKNELWKLLNSYTVNRNKANDFNMHFSGYGLGWGLSDYYGRLRVGHTGGYDGMISAVTMIPDEKLGVVVLSNGMNPPMMAVTYYALNAFLGEETKDWSTDLLKRKEERSKKDTRVEDRLASRVEGTHPSLELEKYTGTYKADIYGNIEVKLENGKLRVYFERSPELSATLEHWHYDVWKLNWDIMHAWFNFGTLKFNMDNNLQITGMDFDVPNNDIFFEELKPRKEN